MTDHIEIKSLHLRTIIGIKEQECSKRQNVLKNLTQFADTHTAGDSDDIADAAI